MSFTYTNTHTFLKCTNVFFFFYLLALYRSFMQQTSWLMTDTDHAENERLVNVALVALSPSLNCMFHILLRKALQLCSEYPTILILIQPAAGGGERDQLSCHLQLIWFSPQSSRHKAQRLKSVFIYKKAHTRLTLSFLHPFWPKKKNHCSYCIFSVNLQPAILLSGHQGQQRKIQVTYEAEREKEEKATAT